MPAPFAHLIIWLITNPEGSIALAAGAALIGCGLAWLQSRRLLR